MDHLAIPVRDQERSRRFYETYLGFGARPPRRYSDGVLMIHDASGFALALGPAAEPPAVPAWMHFGRELGRREAVHALARRLAADGVEIVERWDEPGYVSVKFRDPDGYVVEAFWEPPTAAEAAEVTRRILAESGALLEGGHIVCPSGAHAGGWIDTDAVSPHADRVERLGALLAAACADAGAEVVCGPAAGGLVIAPWTARRLGVPAALGEHGARAARGGRPRPFALRRGHERLVAGRRVLVVDDVLDTGASLRGAIEAVRSHGGVVETAAVVVDRDGAGARDLGVDALACLLEHRLDSWPASECPLCRDGVPVSADLSHGRTPQGAGAG